MMERMSCGIDICKHMTYDFEYTSVIIIIITFLLLL
jgi:hypothetical protein